MAQLVLLGIDISDRLVYYKLYTYITRNIYFTDDECCILNSISVYSLINVSLISVKLVKFVKFVKCVKLVCS